MLGACGLWLGALRALLLYMRFEPKKVLAYLQLHHVVNAIQTGRVQAFRRDHWPQVQRYPSKCSGLSAWSLDQGSSLVKQSLACSTYCIITWPQIRHLFSQRLELWRIRAQVCCLSYANMWRLLLQSLPGLTRLATWSSIEVQYKYCNYTSHYHFPKFHLSRKSK